MSGIEDLRLRDWTPSSQLRAPVTRVDHPAVGCIDAHNHLGRWLSEDGDWIIKDVAALLEMMDERHVEVIVNLDGFSGDELEANLDRYDRAHPGRFLTLCQLDWGRLAEPGGAESLVATLEDCARRGARGVKVWKNLGLAFRDAGGSTAATG